MQLWRAFDPRAAAPVPWRMPAAVMAATQPARRPAPRRLWLWESFAASWQDVECQEAVLAQKHAFVLASRLRGDLARVNELPITVSATWCIWTRSFKRCSIMASTSHDVTSWLRVVRVTRQTQLKKNTFDLRRGVIKAIHHPRLVLCCLVLHAACSFYFVAL